jgi:hypothetical protein
LFVLDNKLANTKINARVLESREKLLGLLNNAAMTWVHQSGRHNMAAVQSRGIMQGRRRRTSSAYYVQLVDPGHQTFNTEKRFAKVTETCWEDAP